MNRTIMLIAALILTFGFFNTSGDTLARGEECVNLVTQDGNKLPSFDFETPRGAGMTAVADADGGWWVGNGNGGIRFTDVIIVKDDRGNRMSVQNNGDGTMSTSGVNGDGIRTDEIAITVDGFVSNIKMLPDGAIVLLWKLINGDDDEEDPDEQNWASCDA